MSARKRKKVFIGMSGGVDSSVAAALLKKAGHEVVGVFIRVWEPSGFVCNWREERREARRAAARLDIPLITLDLSQEYKKKVVDYFIAEYKTGRTPNPDVMCNKYIKFGVFYDWAMEHGADYVATGHYTRVEKTRELSMINSQFPNLKIKNIENSLKIVNYELKISKDLDKDQTYFLWNLHQSQLPYILFPIGNHTKPQVRALAKKFNLPNADKKDSQGLCFIGPIDFKDFLKRELGIKKGNVLNERGEIIGSHDGVVFFTIGERHGFDIFTKTPNEKPYYIVAKNVKKNTLTVSHDLNNQKESLIKEVKIEKTNWTVFSPETQFRLSPKLGFGGNFLARVRYRQPLQSCHLTQINTEKKTATIIFSRPQLAVPGQSLVLYDKNICLGGGIIVR